MGKSYRSSRASNRRTRIAAALVVAASAAALHAQQPAAAPASSQPPTLNLDLQAALHPPLDPASSSSSSSSIASSSGTALTADRLNLEADPGPDGNLQPPPRRRRYGRPNYNDRWHNSDGSNRIAFVVGGGFNLPVGSASSDYLGLNYRFEAGAGINFSQKFAVLAQFDYDRFSIPGSVLRNQENLYTNVTGDTQNSFAGLDGNAHIWSLTLNPTFVVHQGDTFGAYVVAGGGYYHKVSNFTVPSVGTYCDYYGFCYQYQSNQIIDHYTSNSPGVTGGVGITYKLSRFSNQHLFAEARYVHTFNEARLGDPAVTGASTGTPYNLYPPNSNETSYIPITFGIRF